MFSSMCAIPNTNKHTIVVSFRNKIYSQRPVQRTEIVIKKAFGDFL